MKKKALLFISDFDGTATKKDVYLLFLEKYHDETFQRTLAEKSSGKEFTCFEYLNTVFNDVNQSEEQILNDLREIEFDDYLLDFISYVKENSGDFVIVSAGGACYIEKILAYNGLSNIPFHANVSKFINGGVAMFHDETSPFHSYKYGVDKEKIVNYYRESYDMILYAGDSTPDYKAGIAADYRFAKGLLRTVYEEDGVDYYSFETFAEIEDLVREKILIEE